MLNLGYLLTVLTTLSTAAAMAAYLPGVRKSAGAPLLHIARPAIYITALGLLASSIYLWHLLIGHHFEYDYVFRYSSREMPFRYVFSAFWGGQEGTFLLWALFGGLLAVMLRFKAKQYEAPVLFFYLGINLFLMLMLLKASPFSRHDVAPADGNGLNPLLQDPWMTIHPPIMFFGFASLGIPAAYAMAALVKEDWDNWVRRAVPWTTFGVMALGTGLLLGGYWAYSILGWGGFWGWDPVENSSLVPWLVAVALLHNQVIQMKRNIFRRSNVLIAMLPFILLTYSTFLTRSGVLADFSVHSFTDLGINQFLVAFMVVFLGGGLALFVWKFKRIPTEKTEAPLFSREYVIFLGSLAFGLFALFVLLGTSSPIYTRWWGPASSVPPLYYNRAGLPFAILIGILMGFSPYLLWMRTDLRASLRQALIPVIASLLLGVVYFFFGVRNIQYLLMMVAGTFAALGNLWLAARMMTTNWRGTGGYLAHVGIGLAIVGILTSTAYSTKQSVVLPKGQEVLALGYGFKYLGTRPVEEGRKNAYDVTLRTADSAYLMSPTMFFSDMNAGMMKKPALQPFLMRDVYLSPIATDMDPLEDRIEKRVMLVKDQSQDVLGIPMVLRSAHTEPFKAPMMPEGAEHSTGTRVSAMVEATVNGEAVTLSPSFLTFTDGHTSPMPAEIPGAGSTIRLLGVNADASIVQFGIVAPPTVLGRGATAQIGEFTVELFGYDVDTPARQGGSTTVYAHSKVTVGGQSFEVRPAVISRPGSEELERIEAPIGNTGMNLVLKDVDGQTAMAQLYVAPAPQEYFYAEVSTKPFIGLLWMGTAVVLIGLIMATLHRWKLAGKLATTSAGGEKPFTLLKKNGKREAA
jgi:cytochrome c-type biogenesis protein CcmF